MMPVCIIGLFMVLLGNLSSNTVVKTVKSPDCSYYAEVIDNDQGALGGATYVNIYENKVYFFGFFAVQKKSSTFIAVICVRKV